MWNKRMMGILAGGLLAASLAVAAVAPVADAVQKADKATLTALLKQKADVNAAQGDGMTALHWAAYRGDTEAADALVKAGANVKVVTRNGNITPFSLACQNGNAAMIQLLLTAGADPNAVILEGQTPLMTAAHSGNLDAVNVLLSRGVNVNTIEPFRGQTALMWAAAEKHPAIVKALLAKGADPNIRSAVVNIGGGRAAGPRLDENGNPIVELASAAPVGKDVPPVPLPRPEGVLFSGGVLAAGGKVSAPFTVKGGLTALIYAAREGDLESTKILVESGVDVNQQASGDKSTALIETISNGHLDLANYLLDKGANPNLLNFYGESALYAAVDFRNVEISWRPTPRTFEEKVDTLGLIKILLDHKADPNIRLLRKLPFRSVQDRQWMGTAGATAFWRAAVSDDVDTMKLLVDRGADPNIPSYEGNTALMVAAGIGWEGGATQTWPDALIPAVKFCLDHGADINAENIYGYSALHGAGYRGNNDLIKFMVEKGANVMAKNKAGQTARDMANGSKPTDDAPIVLQATVDLFDQLMAGKK